MHEQRLAGGIRRFKSCAGEHRQRRRPAEDDAGRPAGRYIGEGRGAIQCEGILGAVGGLGTPQHIGLSVVVDGIHGPEVDGVVSVGREGEGIVYFPCYLRVVRPAEAMQGRQFRSTERRAAGIKHGHVDGADATERVGRHPAQMQRSRGFLHARLDRHTDFRRRSIRRQRLAGLGGVADAVGSPHENR